MFEEHSDSKNIWFGKIVDIRCGKALSDKHFPKHVFLIVSEYDVKNGLGEQTDFGKADLSNCYGFNSYRSS